MGNGKGFDYSKNAIETAKELFSIDSEFIQGCIGEVDYSEEMFDVIISMDTMYFALDMSEFVDQIMKWLKRMEFSLFVIRRGM